MPLSSLHICKGYILLILSIRYKLKCHKKQKHVLCKNADQ